MDRKTIGGRIDRVIDYKMCVFNSLERFNKPGVHLLKHMKESFMNKTRIMRLMKHIPPGSFGSVQTEDL